MHFDLVDAVIERSGGGGEGGVPAVGDRVVTIKQVSAAEEYLQDHFPGFPVLPGVLMVEAMVQAARELLRARGGGGRLVLGGVRALKYGRFVKPGEALRVEVTLYKDGSNGQYEFKGEGRAVRPWAGDRGAGNGGAEGSSEGDPVAVSGRFTLRPIRLGLPVVGR